jgi:hypothetical protein
MTSINGGRLDKMGEAGLAQGRYNNCMVSSGYAWLGGPSREEVDAEVDAARAQALEQARKK